MVITDLDGTLIHRDRRLSEIDRKTLVKLGARNIIRIIATGRSLFSVRKVLSLDFPIDYLIFSSGAGIMDWPKQELLLKHSMAKEEVEEVFKLLLSRGLDFMVHDPIPDNHFFIYFQTEKVNPDFIKRCEIYQEFATAGDPVNFVAKAACQYVAIEPYLKSSSQYEEIKRELKGLMVIRTTSPLDGRSTWMEIFNRKVSKSQAGAWIAGILGVERQKILAVGNDYNDLDLLKWAGAGFVVQDSPAELLRLFPTVSAEGSCFTEAVSLWQKAP